MKNKVRKNSVAFAGGAFGDEGKGRIVDEYVSQFVKKGPVMVYRDNGGANAGHTVELGGKRLALHQLPSGVFVKGARVVLGKNMVLHPADLIRELNQAKEMGMKATVAIDELAVLCLDTHRAYEAVLKGWNEGGKAATGRGISPAYADVLLRHPLRMRDLVEFDEKKFISHYKLYQALIKGLGKNLAEVEVPALGQKKNVKVGSFKEFFARLKQERRELVPLVDDVYDLLKKAWNDKRYAFVFEKAQAIGLDTRWGVYPDITASDTTFDGIFSSTDGLIDPQEIEHRVMVLKATYMSSVGTRILPAVMNEKLANKIREDANEYGATTGRPRGVVHFDVPAIRFFADVSKANGCVLTHMDIVYPDTPIKICVGYTLKGKPVPYRPDQVYLSKVKPVYRELAPWSKEKIQAARTKRALPQQAKTFLTFIEKELGIPVIAITTGPGRSQGITL